MNILVVTTSYPAYPGDPAGHFVDTEVNELREQGHQVWVLCPRPPSASRARSDFVHHFEGGGLFGSPGAWPRVRQRPWRILWLIPAAFTLWQKKKQLPPPDHIIAHWLWPGGLPFGLWLKDSAAELTVVVHGTDLNLLMQLPTRWIDRILSPLAKRGSSLRFVSAALKNQLLGRHLSGLVKEMVTRAQVRPSPLQLNGPSNKEAARKLLCVPLEQRLLVIVGRLIKQKRTPIALGAASLVPNARIVVLGEGPERSSLMQQIPHATFLGAVPHDEALCWIQAADMLLSASRWEGAPTAIREALALGTLVVSPAIADLPEWAKHEPSLWLVQ